MDCAPYSKFPFALKPDCSVYAKDNKRAKLDFSCVDFVIEFKKHMADDPFIDDPLNRFVSRNKSAREVLGQLTAYAAAILSSQYRTHAFIAPISARPLFMTLNHFSGFFYGLS